MSINSNTEKRLKMIQNGVGIIIFMAALMLLLTAILIFKENVQEPVPTIINDKEDEVLSELTLNPPPPTSPHLDIPLSAEEQEFVYKLLAFVEYDWLKPKHIYAIMDVESDFRKEIQSKTNDFGIMQINGPYYTFYQEYNRKPYKIYNTDLNNWFDFKTNVITGVNALGWWYEQAEKTLSDPDITDVLSMYNQGYIYLETHNKTYANKVMKEVKKYGQEK